MQNMPTARHYELKEVEPAKASHDLHQSEYCAYKSVLPSDHKECGVSMLVLPMHNPPTEELEDFNRVRLRSREGVPEYGGICKHARPSVKDFCNYCRTEFKEGDPGKTFHDLHQSECCVYKNALPSDSKQCGIEIFDILELPMRNPPIEEVEDFYRLRFRSRAGVPEYGGICKHARPSVKDFCNFCRKEACENEISRKKEKAQKRKDEIDFLLKNIHRIRREPDEGEPFKK